VATWYRSGFWLVSALLLIGASHQLYLTLGGGPRAGSSESPNVVVATVDGEPITRREIVEEMARRDRLSPGMFAEPGAKLELLEERIRFETLVARARAAGYSEDPELREEWKRLLVRRYESEHLDVPIAALRVSDEEVARYYDAHRADYTRPERRRVAVIFIELPPRATAEQVRAKAARAEVALAEAEGERSTGEGAAQGFGVLAKRYSNDRATRYRGGDVGWLARGQDSYRWEPAVVDAMFALETPGDLSSVVRGERGFYLVKLIELEAARPQPLERVEPTIRRALLDAKRRKLGDAFYAELAEQTRIEIDLDALRAVPAPKGVTTAESHKRPPPLPGG
jgi:parvulin-like peptidyl-prolyl isomerase